MRSAEFGVESDNLELHLTSPVNTRDTTHVISGIVRTPNSELRTPNSLEGGSIRIRSLATGLTEEAFLDHRGTFAQEIELQAETDNALELAVCDGAGDSIARVVATVRHQAGGRPLGRAVLPTQLITKPLQVEVLNHVRQRTKKVIVPVGATLPGAFQCTCRTRDQTGRIVVPIFEENRVIKEMVIDHVDPELPVGSAVEIELAIDVKHTIEVRVRASAGRGRPHRDGDDRTCTPSPTTHARRDRRSPAACRGSAVAVQRSVSLTGARKVGRLREELLEALRYDDEPKSIQRMAELRDLLQQLETGHGQPLDPPWPRFAQLVKQCLDVAVVVAKTTGREREELLDYIHAQERYAEKAYEDHNQPLYRECRENLEKYARYLDEVQRHTLPRPVAAASRSPEEEAHEGLDRFRSYLATVWKRAKATQRGDLDARLKEIASRANGINQRLKADPTGVIRDIRRLGTEVSKIEDLLDGKRRAGVEEDAGLLEGSA